MGYVQGFQSWAALAAEKTWGVISAGPTWEYQAIIKNGIKPMKAPVAIPDIVAGRYLARHLRGPLRVAGPLSYTCDCDGITGRLLWYLLGKDTVTDHGAGMGGLHTFTSDTIASLGAGISCRYAHDAVAVGTDVWQCLGGLPTKIAFSMKDAKSYLTADADVVFASAASGATVLTPTYPVPSPFPTWGATITVDTAACPMTDFNIAIDPGFNAERTDLAASSGLIIKPLLGMVKVTGSFTAYFDSLTLVNKILNGTVAAFDVKFIGPLIGSDNHASYIQFQVPACYYTGEIPTTDGPGEMMVKVAFETYKGAGEFITVLLENSQRTAYADAAT